MKPNMTQEPLKAACIQLATGSIVNANLLEATRIVEEAAQDGARLIVLPENFAFMGNSCSELATVGEADSDGPLQQFLSELAARLGVWIVGGTIPIKATHSDQYRAACLLVDDNGNQVARYDKMHLFDVNLVETDERYVESETIESGSQISVTDTPFGRLGLAVCYDLRFPELFRAMLDQGVEVIALPAAFTALTGKAHWESLLRARAIENLCYVLASAQGGFHVSGRETHGHSMIVDPWGSILAQKERGNGFVSAALKADFLSATRRNFPSIDHRRLTCK